MDYFPTLARIVDTLLWKIWLIVWIPNHAFVTNKDSFDDTHFMTYLHTLATQFKMASEK